MTDLQILALFALEDMTILELSDRYFHSYIGYTKRIIVGDIVPFRLIEKYYIAKFEEKYSTKLKNHKECIESNKGTW